MNDSPSNLESQETGDGQSLTNNDPKKKKITKKRLIIIGAACCVVFGGGCILSWEEGFFPFSSSKNKQAHEQEERIKNLLASHLLLGIPAVTANLDGGNGNTVYVKMAANVEIDGRYDSATLQEVIPKVQDVFQTYLHETRPQELHGSGFYRLKETILRRLRVTLSPLNVTNIYITELLTQ
ncbi:flagellar basal body-associated protein FliL (plasmid) [Aristophania vespae]|uniref:Flagellar protein FliL n=1 Tax=Aristophania vespae TaxID=2697033 RepID=A0A6P1NJ06_9PROT|nr:flagellar basal body-associated FliL family protein [Aristophania vespae]QHI96510.1 flagellar basal body-associated protein FliL [Aristophania vespae]UMM64804.1 hypothetical protein DM15PD_18240 [Aristophania vespae]